MKAHRARPREQAGHLRRALGVNQRPELIVIAASTGGPSALREVLVGLPADFAIPVVVIQHLPARFIAPFVKQLNRSMHVRVRAAQAGLEAAPGTVWLAPGATHTSLRRDARGRLHFVNEDGAPIAGCQPAADVLFGAAARLCGENCLAVVLTGMGNDGCEGARRVVEAGGQVFVQDRASSMVWGMPGAVVRAGLPCHVVALESMAAALRMASTR